MAEFGKQVGQACLNGGVIFLDATLGMGKTTLSRAIIQGLGWQGGVKSPTYTLVEQYPVAGLEVHHFDLYRLADPEELEYLGIRDLDTEQSLWLVEWPDKGAGVLPQPDLTICIHSAEQETARAIDIVAHSQQGQHQLTQLQQKIEMTK